MNLPLPRSLRAIGMLVTLGALGACLARAADPDEGFEPLFLSLDADKVSFVAAPPETWSLHGQELRCSGVPNGYLATLRSYRNFVLKLDFRYVRPADLVDDASFPGNSGYLLYITGEPKVWPQCVEVQGRNRDAGRIIAIGGAPAVKANDNAEARARRLRSVGEWNSLEIHSQDGAVIALLNGEVVCTSEAGPLREGPIGFQSEGREIHFRGIRIKELP